jgi:hypothetical protein
MDMLISAKGIDEKTKAIAAVIASSKHYREELEAWGTKEKGIDTIKFIIEERNERVSPAVEH